MKLPFTSSQLIAGVLGAGVLLAGAFAVGRASSPSVPTAPLAGPVSDTAPGAPAPLKSSADARETSVAAGPTAPAAGKASADSAPALCGECARVTEVHEETRQGKASGIGAVGGAVLGGLLGHQVGGGTGKKIATIGGAVAGGYAGNEIEKRQKSHRVWVVRLSHADGSTQRLEQAQDPGLRAGDVVVVRDGRIERRER